VGIAQATSTTNGGTRGAILFVGDSNVTMSTQAIEWTLTYGDHFNNGYVPIMASRVGASIRTEDCPDPQGCPTNDYWKIKLAGLLPKVTPDAIVSDLGINDTWGNGTMNSSGTSFYGSKIDWFMGLVPKDKPVIWTNLPCDLEPTARQPRCKLVNSYLGNAQSRWPNLHVLDFASVASGHSDYMFNNDIHLSTLGQLAWANLVVTALDNLLPPA
jgi:hypothetical protein